MPLTRTGILLKPNNKRLLGDVLSEFHGRHQKLLVFFMERSEAVRHHLLTDRTLADRRRLLIGSYFTPALCDRFTLGDLEASLARTSRLQRSKRGEREPVAAAITALAKANYEIECDPASDISERVLFPYSPAETNGIEDARFVRFVEDDGSVHYYATCTAFDGSVTLPQFIETDDFLRFRVSTLNGPVIANKGMALFPRRVNGSYAMLSRQDGENIHLMESDMLHFWHGRRLVLRPTQPWEFVQIGNCGSPIETTAG